MFIYSFISREFDSLAVTSRDPADTSRRTRRPDGRGSDGAEGDAAVRAHESLCTVSHKRAHEDANREHHEVPRGEPSKPPEMRAPKRRAIRQETEHGLETLDDVLAIGGGTLWKQTKAHRGLKLPGRCLWDLVWKLVWNGSG